MYQQRTPSGVRDSSRDVLAENCRSPTSAGPPDAVGVICSAQSALSGARRCRLLQHAQRFERSKRSRRLRKRLALTPDLDQLVHAADLATGPKFDQIATAVITMMMIINGITSLMPSHVSLVK